MKDVRSMRKKIQPSGKTYAVALRRGALALFAASMSMAALAAPGNPGVPSDPVTKFLEDFESRIDRAVPEGIETYNGSKYVADDYWKNHLQCNGIVYSVPNIPPSGSGQTVLGCPEFRGSHVALTALAKSLAVLHGTPTDTETVLAGFTLDESVVGAPGVVFETATPLPIPGNRFITVGADVADYSCVHGGSPARYTFRLLGAASDISLSKSAVNACDGRRIRPDDVYVASLKGNSPVLSTAGGMRISVSNDRGDWLGNDAAIDNIGLFDVTPQLDKQFAQGPLANGAFAVNATARMTFTITNTKDLLEKAGWGFVENLPDGLVIAPTPNLTVKDCVFVAQPVATAGSKTLVISNGSLRDGNSSGVPTIGPPSCSISVDVTSATPGTYNNTPANISSLIGLDPPGNASVTFVKEPVIRLQKALVGGRVKDTDQFSLSIIDGAAVDVTVTTAGSGAAVLNSPAVLNPAKAGTRYTLYELPAETPVGSTVLTNYVTTYACANATSGGQTPSGIGTSFSVVPAATDDLTCTITNSALVADLQVVKTPNVTSLRSGGLVTFSIVATNAGPAAVNNAILRDVPGAGLDCVTPSPNATCTADTGAACPGPTVGVSDLTSTAGVTIPSMPPGGRITLSMQCRVTATGLL